MHAGLGGSGGIGGAGGVGGTAGAADLAPMAVREVMAVREAAVDRAGRQPRLDSLEGAESTPPGERSTSRARKFLLTPRSGLKPEGWRRRVGRNGRRRWSGGRCAYAYGCGSLRRVSRNWWQRRCRRVQRSRRSICAWRFRERRRNLQFGRHGLPETSNYQR